MRFHIVRKGKDGVITESVPATRIVRMALSKVNKVSNLCEALDVVKQYTYGIVVESSDVSFEYQTIPATSLNEGIGDFVKDKFGAGKEAIKGTYDKMKDMFKDTDRENFDEIMDKLYSEKLDNGIITSTGSKGISSMGDASSDSIGGRGLGIGVDGTKPYSSRGREDYTNKVSPSDIKEFDKETAKRESTSEFRLKGLTKQIENLAKFNPESFKTLLQRIEEIRDVHTLTI